MPRITTIIHGNRSTYVNRVCRCDLCRAANAAYAKAQRDAAVPPPLPPEPNAPGTAGALRTPGEVEAMSEPEDCR